MNGNNEEFEELVPEESDGSGPFAVGSVDALVYKMDDTSPELRAAASYIPVAPKLTIRDSAPLAPEKRKHEAWTPGGGTIEPSEAPNIDSGVWKIARSSISFLLVFIPLGVIAAVVWFAWSLYNSQ